jgi:hypothetical protein
MLGGFREAQNRREADVRALHDRAPLIPFLLFEKFCKPIPHGGPVRAIELPRAFGRIKAERLQQNLIEFRFNGANRDNLPSLVL